MQYPRSSTSDAELLEAFAGGSRAAFDSLVARYDNRLLHFILRYGLSQLEAEEILQDVFVNVLESHDSLRRKTSIGSWMFSITRNRCLNHLRRLRRQPVMVPLGSNIPSLREEPETESRQVEELRQLENLIRELPPGQRELLHLRFHQQLSFAEIGEIINQKEAAVRQRYHRLLKDLWKQMK
ncbi:RNA polymerase sigma factor [Planctomycetota bacterium]